MYVCICMHVYLCAKGAVGEVLKDSMCARMCVYACMCICVHRAQ